MKKTRNLFILTGNKQDVEIALSSIQFKGVTVLAEDNISAESFLKVFKNNKSVVCTHCPEGHLGPIFISVINDTAQPLNNSVINIAHGNIVGQFASIAEKLNCDIGDHKSNDSGEKDAPKITDCAYCRYLLGESNSEDRTIYSSKNFFVVPTLGEFINGYLLIIPYRHVMSTAELEPCLHKELLTVIEDVSYLLNLTYGSSNFLVWENGTGNSGRGKAKDSIVHAHTHIAPSFLTADKIEEMSGFQFKRITTKELSEYDHHSYLLVKDGKHWKISNNPETYIPRQYVRQLLADEHGLVGERWNWRVFPYRNKMMETYWDIAKAICANWEDLPDRIKLNTQDYI